jgi:hypothetical protein
MMKAVRIKPEAGITAHDHTAIHSWPMTGEPSARTIVRLRRYPRHSAMATGVTGVMESDEPAP